MPRYSLKSIFVVTALVAVEAFLTREMVFRPYDSSSVELAIIWLLYGILLGGALLAIAMRGGSGAFMIGMILGGFGQCFIWLLLLGGR